MPPNARTDTIDNEPEDSAKNPYSFPVTQWSVVVRASSSNPTESIKALASICEQYWLPLYAYARSSGNSPEDAEDITQGFIFTLLKRKSLHNVVQERGRLRSFLLRGMKNHMVSEFRKETAQRRGGEDHRISMDDAERQFAEDQIVYAGLAQSPAEVFERRWALALLERVVVRLRDEYEEKNATAVFESLRPFLAGKDASQADAYNVVAEKLQITPNFVSVKIHRLKKRYQELLRQEVAATVAPEELEDELRYLCALFQR